MLTTTGVKAAPQLKEVIMAVSIQEIIVKRHKRKWESYYKLKEVINAAYLSETGRAVVILKGEWPWRHNIHTNSLILFYSFNSKGRRLTVVM